MSSKYNVAIVGATGIVGETILEVLEQRKFPVAKLYLLASESSVGKRYQFASRSLMVEALDTFDFTKVDFAFFSAGSDVSEEFAPQAAALGCKVIDNTSHFRYDDDKALVVPEVNPHRLGELQSNIIATPNCSTIQMVVALKPIYDAVGIKRINVATYQAVSGTGKSALEELAAQTAQLLNMKKVETKIYPKQIAFNVLPQIGAFMENGYTREEMKMVWETKKIFEDDSLQINPTAVRVPVFYGHSEAVHLETGEKITVDRAKELLKIYLVLFYSIKQLMVIIRLQ